jgi:hypothetical protein
MKDFGFVRNGAVSLIVVSSLGAWLVNDTRSFETSGITQRRGVARCSCTLETFLMKSTGCFEKSATTFPAMQCHILKDRKPLTFLLLLLLLLFSSSSLVLNFNVLKSFITILTLF